jgi:hypothetical protein
MTPRALAMRHKKRLASIRNSLVDMAAQWGEVDEYFVAQLSELADQCVLLRAELAEVYPGRGKAGEA